MEKLISRLKELAKLGIDLATFLRTEAPETSFFYFQMAEACKDAAKELEKQIPQEMEMEGGGYNWWYVCPDCHGAIDSKDHFCRYCGKTVKSE